MRVRSNTPMVQARPMMAGGPAIARQRGMGDAAACGDDPCTWWDSVWMRDACISYRYCVNPADPLANLVSNGLIVGGAQTIGQTLGQAVNEAVEGVFNPAGIPDPTKPAFNWTPWIIGGLAAVLILPRLTGAIR